MIDLGAPRASPQFGKAGYSEHPQSSRQVWIWMAGEEALGCRVLDVRVVGQPLRGAAVAADVAVVVPHGRRVRIFWWSSSLNPAEGSLALDGPGSPER
jgi:hypothetical protein